MDVLERMWFVARHTKTSEVINVTRTLSSIAPPPVFSCSAMSSVRARRTAMYRVRATTKQRAKKPLGRRSIPFRSLRFVGGGESGRWPHWVRPSEDVSKGWARRGGVVALLLHRWQDAVRAGESRNSGWNCSCPLLPYEPEAVVYHSDGIDCLLLRELESDEVSHPHLAQTR